METLTSQALVRAARTLGAALIATAVTVLPQVVGVFELDPAYTTAVIVGLTALLNGLGKLMREPTIEVSDVDAARAAVDASPTVSSVKSAPIPF